LAEPTSFLRHKKTGTRFRESRQPLKGAIKNLTKLNPLPGNFQVENMKRAIANFQLYPHCTLDCPNSQTHIKSSLLIFVKFHPQTNKEKTPGGGLAERATIGSERWHKKARKAQKLAGQKKLAKSLHLAWW
jgi:hypothetical protein